MLQLKVAVSVSHIGFELVLMERVGRIKMVMVCGFFIGIIISNICFLVNHFKKYTNQILKDGNLQKI